MSRAPLTTEQVSDEYPPRQPQWVECNCGHKWVGFYTPMPLSWLADLMQKLACPMCANDATQIFMADGSVS